MRDLPGQGPIAPDTGSDAYTVLDVSGRFAVSKASEIYARADNLLDARYVVSRRPFGARPGKPLQIAVGYKYRFE